MQGQQHPPCVPCLHQRVEPMAVEAPLEPAGTTGAGGSGGSATGAGGGSGSAIGAGGSSVLWIYDV